MEMFDFCNLFLTRKESIFFLKLCFFSCSEVFYCMQ